MIYFEQNVGNFDQAMAVQAVPFPTALYLHFHINFLSVWDVPFFRVSFHSPSQRRFMPPAMIYIALRTDGC